LSALSGTASHQVVFGAPNPHAAYRKIPILGNPPAAVTYTRANTRNVYRKTIDEIADMLSNIASPAAIADRQRLETLDRRITHLALVSATEIAVQSGTSFRSTLAIASMVFQLRVVTGTP
jgi:hypothetical protein